MLLYQCQITCGQFFMFIGQRASLEGFQFVQPLKGFGELAVTRLLNRLPIFLDALAFLDGFGQGRILAPDIRQLDGPDAGMFFNGPQCVARLNGTVLMRVTRQNQSRTVFSHQPEQFHHLIAANGLLAGLVHNDHGSRFEFLLLQETGNGRGRRKSVRLHA